MNWKHALITSFLALSLVSCAGSKLKTTMKDDRRYSDADIELIMTRMEPYKRRLVAADMSSNAFNTAPRQNEEAQLKAVFCNCWKRMKARCQQRPTGLSGEDKDLWLKSNAVEMAFASLETAIDTKPNTMLDGAECN